MFGFNVVDPGTTRLRHQVAANVSDVFVTRYIRGAMDDDPLREAHLPQARRRLARRAHAAPAGRAMTPDEFRGAARFF